MIFQKIGILCGFHAEAGVARALTPHVACSGAVEELARQRTLELIQNGATVLISFGVSGGLHDSLTPEHIVIPDIVRASNGRQWNTTLEINEWLRRAAPDARHGSVYGSRFLVPRPNDKKKLRAESACDIVDMESHVIAECATEAGLPFAVLRGVSDSIEDTFPPAALRGINPDGSTNNMAVTTSLIFNPFQLPALKRLFKNTGTSLQQLAAVVEKLDRNYADKRNAA
jgi:hypothetical protein